LPQAILGAQLVERVSATGTFSLSGTDINSATGMIAGIVLTPPGTKPTLAADGSNFHSRPVIQTVKATTAVLTTGDLASPLLAASTRPYVAIVARSRAAGVTDDGWFMLKTTVASADVALSVEAYDDAGTLGVYVTSTNNNTAISPVNGNLDYRIPAFYEYIHRSDGIHLYRNGTEIASTNAAAAQLALSSSVSLVEVGRSKFGPGNASVADMFICSSEPSSSQRAALLVWAQGFWL
jgi:hypothetical protein